MDKLEKRHQLFVTKDYILFLPHWLTDWLTERRYVVCMWRDMWRKLEGVCKFGQSSSSSCRQGWEKIKAIRQAYFTMLTSFVQLMGREWRRKVVTSSSIQHLGLGDLIRPSGKTIGRLGLCTDKVFSIFYHYYGGKTRYASWLWLHAGRKYS